MLPSIPPTTLHDLARDYRGVPRDTDRRFATRHQAPARRRPRALFATTDQKEGMAAFGEKRKPAFRDE